MKVSIPLTEIIKNDQYKVQVAKLLRVDQMFDMVNVSDDHPEVLFGLVVDGDLEDSEVPAFYLSLKIHDFILHNSMLGSGSSHNLIPKAIIDKLGLDITRTYHDLYSFDSGRVKSLGLIKDLVVSLEKIPAMNVLMDVVVADIPLRYRIFLSWSWGAKLKGTVQLNFSYAAIPTFSQLRKLYRKNKIKYMISSRKKPNNHRILVFHTDLESFIFFND